MRLTDHRTLLLVLAVVGAVGCAAKRPVLYSNDHLMRVGPKVVKHDIDECMRRAREVVSASDRTGDVARGTAVGGGIGAAAGAAGGAIWGRAGRGAASGAAAGATAGLLRGLFRKSEPNAAYKNFVNRCLGEMGYEMVGWN